MAKRRRRGKGGFGRRVAALVLGAVAGAFAVWSWSRSGGGNDAGPRRASSPVEDIRPSERARLDAVLEGVGKGDAGGKADRR